MIKCLEVLTILFGIGCVAVSYVLARRFSRVNSRLARALTRQLQAEAFVGFITILFAVASLANVYTSLNPWFLVFIRVTIFTTATLSSVNLYKRVREIEDATE